MRELQTRVETLSRDLQKTRNWLGWGDATAVLALVILAAFIGAALKRPRRSRPRANCTPTLPKPMERGSKAEQQTRRATRASCSIKAVARLTIGQRKPRSQRRRKS